MPRFFSAIPAAVRSGKGGGVSGLSAAMAGTAVLVAGIGSDDSP